MFGWIVKYTDIIAEKKQQLADLQAQADHAVDLVTRTISSLEQTNEQISQTTNEIDDYIAKLTETRGALVSGRQRNERVIANFTKLLDVDEVA